MKTARFDTNYFFLILTYGNRHANAVELPGSSAAAAACGWTTSTRC